MSKVTFDYSKACGFVQDHEMQYMSELAEQAKEKLLARTGAGNDFLGWIDLPVDYDKDEFDRIKKAAEKIREDSEVLLVIGIGGSYLGARAAIEFLGHSFANVVSKEVRKSPEIYYVGNSISSTYVKDLIDVIGDRDFSINMISKSGTTTEPAIAFRVFKELLEKKYGKEEAAKRIYATTDKAKGALKNLATEEGYETFVVPDDVGGRFSVLTAVGLLPIAVSGADIDKLMEGAASGRKAALEADFEKNGAMQYAAVRNILLRKGKTVEVLANYEPSLHYVSEWWKQLYGESEGKDQKGIFPASVDLTTDLHSMEQFLQVGAITSTHGIRGEVKVFPTTDDPARFKKLKKVILDTGKRQIDMEIQSVRFFKQFVIVKFKGIDNINDVEQYKGSSLFVSRENAVSLEENEYYIADLIGMEVFTEEGHFGIVKDVMETGANEVYIIDSDVHGEVLVPAIKQCIENVDVENGKMQIRLLEGLIG